MEDVLSSDPTRGSRFDFPFSRPGRTIFVLWNVAKRPTIRTTVVIFLFCNPTYYFHKCSRSRRNHQYLFFAKSWNYGIFTFLTFVMQMNIYVHIQHCFHRLLQIFVVDFWIKIWNIHFTQFMRATNMKSKARWTKFCEITSRLNRLAYSGSKHHFRRGRFWIQFLGQ